MKPLCARCLSVWRGLIVRIGQRRDATRAPHQSCGPFSGAPAGPKIRVTLRMSTEQGCLKRWQALAPLSHSSTAKASCLLRTAGKMPAVHGFAIGGMVLGGLATSRRRYRELPLRDFAGVRFGRRVDLLFLFQRNGQNQQQSDQSEGAERNQSKHQDGHNSLFLCIVKQREHQFGDGGHRAL